MTFSQNDIFNASVMAESLLPRPRVGAILEAASRSKLVYVIAGAGFGKTTAVRHFVEGYPEAVMRWVQLTESDNIGSRYWENLTHVISFDNPELSARLRELGFPETAARFKQFVTILRATEHLSLKTFLVLDDFHLIKSSKALAFAERCAHLQIPGACVILISRSEPDINVVSLFSKGQVQIITEEELRFTGDEITAYLNHRQIPVTPGDALKFLESTDGWALAVHLLSMALKRRPKNPGQAQEAMKGNINKLIETEAFGNLLEREKKALVQMSLISDLPAVGAILCELFGVESLGKILPRISSFVWFDSFADELRVHPLYLDYLRSRQDILSIGEERAVYAIAADWCVKHDYSTDAFFYFSKLGDYGRMLEILLSYPFRLPQETCLYFLGILEGLGKTAENRGERNYLLLTNLFVPLLYAGAGNYLEARERSLSTICEWGESGDEFAPYLLYTAYCNLAYINMYTCVSSHRYDFALNLKNAIANFNRSKVAPVRVKGSFAFANVRSFACLVGAGACEGDVDAFLESSRRASVYIKQTYHCLYYGYEELAACEAAFYRNKIEAARSSAHLALLRSREKNQRQIEMMADFYLLRIAAYDGDRQMAEEMARQLRAHLDVEEFWNRQPLYDLFMGFYYAATGECESAAGWIASDERDEATEAHIPVMELIVGVKLKIAAKNYNRALAVLAKSYPRNAEYRFLFGELTLSLLQAAARASTGDAKGAAADLETAYEISCEGAFPTPFIELGAEFKTLRKAAQEAGTTIPAKWLDMIGRKASAYAKKTGALKSAPDALPNQPDQIRLSVREREVLAEVSRGLSREEIAASRYMSVNTVKKVMQSIFLKLGANNNAEAVRIAAGMKII